MPPRPAFLLLGAAAAGAAGFAALAVRVAERETSDFDDATRRPLPKRRRPATKRAVSALNPLGKEWLHGPVAILAAAYAVGRRRTPAAAAAIVVSSAAAAGLSRAFERLLPHRAPPPGRLDPGEPSFPSGHSLETAAVALTTAYVLAREGLAEARLAASLALAVPLASGVGRLYLDRHWASDVLGGWLAGTALAACCAAGYESARRPRALAPRASRSGRPRSRLWR